MNIKLVIGLIAIILIATSTVSATPGYWSSFRGSINTNGVSAPDNLFLDVYINDDKVATTATLNGMYGYAPYVLVINPPGNESENWDGETVEFYIQGVKSNEDAIYKNGERVDTNLNFGGNICGDTVCGSGENCPADCTGTTTNPTGSSPVFSKGGSPIFGKLDILKGEDTNEEETDETAGDIVQENGDSTSNAASCTPSWECSDWTDCVGTKQKRICVDVNKCGTDDGKPEESMSCGEISDDVLQDTLPDKKEGFFSRITGAVVEGGIAAWGSFVAVIIIIAALITLFFMFKKRGK